MFSLIKDMPDGALGLAVAGALHLSVCYVVLAPRAMEVHLEETVSQPCVAMLTAEQDRAIEDAREDDARSRRQAQSQLNQVEIEIVALEQVTGLYRQSGILDIMGALGVQTKSISDEDIAALRAQAQTMRAVLAQVPDFSHLQASAGQMLQTCSCAALQAAAGKRTSYAISLATFRLIEPEDVSKVSDAALRVAGGDTCGQLPWRQ